MTNTKGSAWLAQARASLEPTPGDQTRVQANLVRVLGSAALPLPSAASPEVEPRLSPNDGAGLAGKSWALALPRPLWLVAGLAIGGVAGYELGAQYKPEQQKPTIDTPSASVSSQVKLATSDQVRSLDPVVEDPVVKEPEITEVSPTLAVPSKNTVKISAALPPSSNSADATPEDREVFQLQRVERALRAGNAQLALSLLSEINTFAPRGRLMEERSAAHIRARCLLGTATGQDDVGRFERRYPNSVHLSRLRQACQR